MTERLAQGVTHRRLICCVLGVEITEHDIQPVFEQIRMTQELRQRLYDTTRDRAQDLISIEREGGALLCFAADARACFTTALALRRASARQEGQGALPLRIGIDVGTVELAEAELGEAYLSGEGRLDAERLMRQGRPCQISVSRSFFELLHRTAPELAGCLQYQGVLSDTIAPPLGWYRLDATLESELNKTASPSASTLIGFPQQGSSRTPPDARSTATAAYWSRTAWARWTALPLLALGVVFALSGPFQRDPPAPQVAVVSQDRTPEANARVQREPASAVKRDPTPAVMAKPTTSAPPPDAGPSPSGASPGDAKAATAKPRSGVRAQTRRTRPIEKPQAATPATALAGTGSGTIHLAVRPWGTVYVDGREVGVTPPLKTFRVASGRRLITIRNNAAPIYRREVTVRPDAKTTVRHDFTCVPTREKSCRPTIAE